MIVDFQVEQGSEDWHALRRGVVTCSNFGAIMGTLAERNRYLSALRETPKPFTSPATTWGKSHEAEALANYQVQTGASIYRAGFMLRDSGPFCSLVGGSPDGVVLGNAQPDNGPKSKTKFVKGQIVGGVEIKCPYNPIVHETYCNSGIPHRYLYQVLGYIWLTGADYWDFVSYDPRNKERPLFMQRIQSSPLWMQTIESKLDEFLHVLKSGGTFIEPSARAVVQTKGLKDFIGKIFGN